jgi:hypothetical protein
VSRDEAAYPEDMVEACTRVIEYTAGIDAAALRADRKTIDAVVRNLEVLGEAAKRVSNTLRARAPGVPWGDRRNARRVDPRLVRPWSSNGCISRPRSSARADSAAVITGRGNRPMGEKGLRTGSLGQVGSASESAWATPIEFAARRGAKQSSIALERVSEKVSAGLARGASARVAETRSRTGHLYKSAAIGGLAGTPELTTEVVVASARDRAHRADPDAHDCGKKRDARNDPRFRPSLRWVRQECLDSEGYARFRPAQVETCGAKGVGSLQERRDFAHKA